VVLQLGGWAWDSQIIIIKNKLITKDHKTPHTWLMLFREIITAYYGNHKIYCGDTYTCIWNCNSQKCIPESFSYFHMDIMSEHLFQCVAHKWHFDTRSNTADRMFNTVTGLACAKLNSTAQGFVGGSLVICPCKMFYITKGITVCH
jgi:hypothetical protein